MYIKMVMTERRFLDPYCTWICSHAFHDIWFPFQYKQQIDYVIKSGLISVFRDFLVHCQESGLISVPIERSWPQAGYKYSLSCMKMRFWGNGTLSYARNTYHTAFTQHTLYLSITHKTHMNTDVIHPALQAFNTHVTCTHHTRFQKFMYTVAHAHKTYLITCN